MPWSMGVDGRTHHIKLPDLDAAGDSTPDRSSNCAFEDARGQRRVAHRRPPDLDIDPRSRTRCDLARSAEHCVAREPVALSEAVWREVRQRHGRRVRASGRTGFRRAAAASASPSPQLIDTLRAASWRRWARSSSAETGLGRRSIHAGRRRICRRLYRQRFTLASGRFSP